ncbi:endonuclease/exonuclease/phosphatase family protein [Gimesia aquarii]|uniref:Endonuclease/exonuclease/phosphatase domain-containing protein n=1 Tax=Gimesia aquarii TaxID=2527964 RepID=A0A517W2T9_9PLAN|nr:endonuclease/exonuclease/phosphatase family protein [Gimesia aquarii]QDT99550.1 hypothetical protein V144x_50620 [Gimesia aquarii]
MTNRQLSTPPEKRSRTTWILTTLVTGFSLLLLLFQTLCYTQQYDACAAVTVYPSWVWFLCGLCFALILIRNKNKRTVVATLCLWLLFLVFFADTPLSLWRGIGSPSDREWIDAREQQRTMRVISLNCSGRKTSVLALKQWEPELILLQETPNKNQLTEITNELMGANGVFLSGVDTSLITRGEIELIAATGNYIAGKITLPSGQELVVASLRLSPPPFRFDLWNPECWRAFRDHRMKQRAEVKDLSQVLAALPTGLPVIVGGDFNANPRDPIFAELPASLQDAFVSAGSGWGNTIINDIPFLRIDQIWINDSFQPVRVIANTSVDTDHRTVIADLIFK